MRDSEAGPGLWQLFARAMGGVGPAQGRLRLVRGTPPAPREAVLAPSAGQPPRPQRYLVELTLDPRQETFRGLMEVELALEQPTGQLWLHGSGLTVQGASVSSRGSTRPARALRYGEDQLGFVLERPVGAGPARLRVAWQGRASLRDAAGVLRREYGGRWYAQTRLRPGEARRVLPSFGEAPGPVPWQLTLRVRPEDRAFANVPVASEELGEDGLRTVRFRAACGPLPTFLVGPADNVRPRELHPCLPAPAPGGHLALSA